MNASRYRTPYNDNYGTCDETHAMLRIYTRAIDPAEVTAKLGLVPTQLTVAGSMVTSTRGRTRAVRSSGWFLSSEGAVRSRDVRVHLDWLIARLVPVSSSLEELQATEGITMAVTCRWWSKGGNGGPALWPAQMRALAELDLELNFEIQFFEAEDDEHENEREN